MEISEKLLECRSNLEEKLRKLTGIAVYISQLSVFSLACGCTGLTAAIKGLQKEEIEVFKSFISHILEKEALHLNINPDVIYAKMAPGTPLVLSLNCEKLCESCREEYEKEEVAPFGDMYLLQKCI